MGRTIPSFRIAETQEVAEWKAFRKSLPQDDKAYFDEMLEEAKLYLCASSAALRTSRFEAMAMAIILHNKKMLAQAVWAISHLQQEMRT